MNINLTPFEENALLIQDFALKVNEMKQNGVKTVSIEEYMKLLDDYIEVSQKYAASHNQLKEAVEVFDKVFCK